MAKLLMAIVFIAVSGCAATPMVQYKGPTLKFQHGTAIDPLAYPMQYAQRYCAQAGLSAQYVRSFYPNIQHKPKSITLLDSRDPGYAGQTISQGGEDLQEAADSLAGMPTSYYKCIKHR